MSQIMTRSHTMFDPLHPDAALVDIEDIAHSLSMLCRANGHFKSFYSVGQHCINCALEARARGYSRRVQLACLLHDASEAYLSDVTRPVKQELPQYKLIEEPLQALIWDKWLRPSLTAQEEKLVFLVDDDILEREFIALMEHQLSPTLNPISSQPQYAFTGFETCKKEFLALFEELINE